MKAAEVEITVLAFQQGDQQAFAEIYKHYHRDLTRFAAYLLGDPHEADALVHEVWLKVVKRIHRLQDPAIFTAWLYRAVRWQVLDTLKQPQRRQTAEFRADLSDTVDPAFESNGEHLSLADAVAKLNPDDQMLLQLFYYQQLEQQHIALVLQIPTGTVKSRLHRIRQQLSFSLQTSAQLKRKRP